MKRHHYGLDLGVAGPFEHALPEGVSSRVTTPADLDDLALLMLESYRATIDYEGEETPEAIAEVEGYFSGEPIPDCSIVLFADGEMGSACLVSD